VEYSDKVRSGDWDGIIRLYKNRRFPVGLLGRVANHLTLDDVPYAIIDQRLTESRRPFEFMGTLRPYQDRIVKAAIAAGNCLIPAATGAGKTVIAAAIIARLGQRSLYIVPTVELLDQTAERIAALLNGRRIGLIGDRQFSTEEVTVATWQTLSRRLKAKEPAAVDLMRSVGCLCLDEVHHYGADEVYSVSLWAPARYRFGLSGTMFRTDGQELKFFAAVGDCIEGVTASQLIDLGFLVPPAIHFVRTPEKVFGFHEKWQDVYKEGIVDNEGRNHILAREANRLVAQGRRTLVLVSQVRHGEILQRLIPGSTFVHSQAKERPDIIEGFRNGRIQCLVSSPLFDEGIDLPEISGIVLAGAGKSQVKAVQRVGRGLRTSPGKTDVTVIETNDPIKYLYEQSWQRYKMYASEPRFKITGAVPQ